MQVFMAGWTVASEIPCIELLHYVDQIKKFGSPLNYFGGFLESFLKDKLKKPSKRINGHLHKVQHHILILITSVLAI
jgi:hypothetical protein